MKKIKNFLILVSNFDCGFDFCVGTCNKSAYSKIQYMFEYDPYWHLRATGYVVQGDLPTNDPLGFYQQGGTKYSGWPNFLWYFTAAIYTITTFGAPYNKWLLMEYARSLQYLVP